MFSSALEVAALAAFVDSVDRLAGRGFAMLAVAFSLALLALATDDAAISGAVKVRVRRGRAFARRHWPRLRRRTKDAEPVSPHPQIEVSPEVQEWADQMVEQYERRQAAAASG